MLILTVYKAHFPLQRKGSKNSGRSRPLRNLTVILPQNLPPTFIEMLIFVYEEKYDLPMTVERYTSARRD